MSKTMAKKPPRELAVRVLTRVLSDHESLDDAVASVMGEIPSASDRAWLQDVVSGTLRWKGRLDLALDSVAIKKKPSGWLRKVLLVGAYQLVVQERVAPATVVIETVDAIKRKEGEAPARFANACLRKISEHALAYRNMEFSPSMSAAEQQAWASMPEWLWKRLVRDHGREWAAAYAKASLERPVTWIRARVGSKAAEAAFAERGEAGPVPQSIKLGDGGAITGRPGFEQGEFFVQDISSQQLVAAISEKASEGIFARPRALDLCAAPGGKSVGLSWSGFEVFASDRDSARYALLESTVSRVAPDIQIVPREEVAGLSPVDLVWVDAPCSGSGILRRHPDVRWLRQEKELASLEAVQQKLLAEAWERVRPGGYLAYSVCSVLKAEGPDALARLMKQVQGEVVAQWFLTPHTAPYGDGFWAALVRKVC